MANKFKGEATLDLGDSGSFTLVFSFATLVEAEAIYNKPLPTLLADVDRQMLGASGALLLALLQRRQPQMDMDDALELITSHGAAVKDAMERLIEAAMPKPVEGKQGAHPRRAPRTAGAIAGTSTASSRNGQKRG